MAARRGDGLLLGAQHRACCLFAFFRQRALLAQALPGQRLHAVAVFAPEEGRKQKARRHRLAFGNALVGVRQGHAGDLLAAGHQPEQHLHQRVLAQQVESALAVAVQEHLRELVEQPRRRDIGEQFGGRRDGLFGARVQRQRQLGGEAQRAQDAHRILAQALRGFADEPQRPRLDVRHAPAVVEDDVRRRVVVQGVDGEVAAKGVFVDGAVGVVAQNQAIRGNPRAGTRAVRAIAYAVRFRHGGDAAGAAAAATESGHFDDLAAHPNMDDAKTPPDDARPREHGAHVFRRGVRGDIEILRRAPDEQVAHAAAHQVGIEPRGAQFLHHRQGVRGHPRPVDAVIGNPMRQATSTPRRRSGLYANAGAAAFCGGSGGSGGRLAFAQPRAKVRRKLLARLPERASGGSTMGFIKEFWLFLKVRKKFWLLPILLVAALFGGMLIATEGTAAAPFIYTIF